MTKRRCLSSQRCNNGPFSPWMNWKRCLITMMTTSLTHTVISITMKSQHSDHSSGKVYQAGLLMSQWIPKTCIGMAKREWTISTVGRTGTSIEVCRFSLCHIMLWTGCTWFSRSVPLRRLNSRFVPTQSGAQSPKSGDGCAEVQMNWHKPATQFIRWRLSYVDVGDKLGVLSKE